MRIQCVGIIAEYDPFHRGHAYQIQMLRRIVPDAAVVVALGGNLTQRGMPAMFEAYDRAKMALVGGADLVLSLPFPFPVRLPPGLLPPAWRFWRAAVYAMRFVLAANAAMYRCFPNMPSVWTIRLFPRHCEKRGTYTVT